MLVDDVFWPFNLLLSQLSGLNEDIKVGKWTSKTFLLFSEAFGCSNFVVVVIVMAFFSSVVWADFVVASFSPGVNKVDNDLKLGDVEDSVDLATNSAK